MKPFVLYKSNLLPFYIIFLLAGIVERVNSTFFCNKAKDNGIIYHKWLFIVPFYAYLFILFCSLGEFLLIIKTINMIILWLGFIIFISAALLRRKSISDLGKNWSLYTEIKENHELITSGIYKCIKHPYYLSVFLELIGICLIANAFYSLMLIFLIQLPLLLIRTVLEERMLINRFGSRYIRYKSGKIL